MAPKVLVLGDGIGGIVTANLLLKKVRKHHLPLDLRLVGNSPIHAYSTGNVIFSDREARISDSRGFTETHGPA